MPTGTPDGQANFGVALAPGAAALQRAVFNLSAAQMLALDGTAITIVQAPGAGLMLLPVAAVVSCYAGANAVTDAGGNFQFNIGTRLYNMASAALTCSANNNVHTTYSFPEAKSTAGAPPTDENAALTFNKAGNNVANTGNTATAAVEVFFRVVAITPAPPTS